MTKPAKASTPKKACVPIKSRLGIRPIETTKCPSQMRLSKRENPISKKSLKVDGKRYVKKSILAPPVIVIVLINLIMLVVALLINGHVWIQLNLPLLLLTQQYHHHLTLLYHQQCTLLHRHKRTKIVHNRH